MAKISKRNEKGETPLHIAAIEGHVTRVKQLIEDVSKLRILQKLIILRFLPNYQF